MNVDDADRQHIRQVLDRMESTPSLLQEHWCISPEVGKFLWFLTLQSQARRVLEIGTSIGYSGLWFLLALVQTDGRLDTIEASPQRAQRAEEAFKEARVQTRVQIHGEDALTCLKALVEKGEKTDVLFLDARKSEYLDYLALGSRLMTSGGLLLADNTQSHRPKMSDFITAIYASPDWDVTELSLSTGLLLARKR